MLLSVSSAAAQTIALGERTPRVKNAKWQLSIINVLLGNNAERARKIIADYRPLFASKEEYFAYVDSLTSTGERIVYNEDGTALIK